MLRRNHIWMFSKPTESRAHRPRLVHHRLNINTHFSLGARLLLANPRQQWQQFFLDYLVIVVSPRITRDFSCAGILLMLVRREVVECDDYDWACRRKDLKRADALLHVAGHPAHLAVITARQPLFQPAPFICKRLGADDSDFVESLEKSPFLDVTRQDHYGIFWIVTETIGLSPFVLL